MFCANHVGRPHLENVLCFLFMHFFVLSFNVGPKRTLQPHAFFFILSFNVCPKHTLQPSLPTDVFPMLTRAVGPKRLSTFVTCSTAWVSTIKKLWPCLELTPWDVATRIVVAIGVRGPLPKTPFPTSIFVSLSKRGA